MGGSTPGLPFRAAGTKGERLPMLEPEHLARRRRRVPAPTLGTVSPTALAHCYSRARLAKVSGRAPALVSLPQGTLVEQGRHPPDPCSRGPVSAKWVPARLAEGRAEAVGGAPARPCPRACAGAFSPCPVSLPALSSLCCFCCMAVLSHLPHASSLSAARNGIPLGSGQTSSARTSNLNRK